MTWPYALLVATAAGASMMTDWITGHKASAQVTAAVLMYRAVTYLPSIPPRRPRLPHLAVCTRAHQHQPVHAAPADPQHDDGTRQLAADLTGSAGTADGSVPVGDTPRI